MQLPSTYPYLLGSTECPKKGKESVFNEPQLQTLDLHFLPKCDPHPHLPTPRGHFTKPSAIGPSCPSPSYELILTGHSQTDT